jgi:hypothetical protein
MAVEVDVDVDPLGGAASGSHNVYHLRAPWGELSAGPTASTTEVEEDVDGKPPRGRCRRVRQRPPPMLKTTSMVGPLGALLAGSSTSTTEVEEDVNGGPPMGRYWWVR